MKIFDYYNLLAKLLYFFEICKYNTKKDIRSDVFFLWWKGVREALRGQGQKLQVRCAAAENYGNAQRVQNRPEYLCFLPVKPPRKRPAWEYD